MGRQKPREATSGRSVAPVAWLAQGKDVFVYFDNDQKSAAPADAFRLEAFLSRAPKTRARQVA